MAEITVARPAPEQITPFHLSLDGALLLSLIPPSWIEGTVEEIVEAADGLVIVTSTPTSDFGSFEVTAWAPRLLDHVRQDLAESGEGWDESVSMVEAAFSGTLQCADEVPAAVQSAREALLDRAAHAAASHVRRPAITS